MPGNEDWLATLERQIDTPWLRESPSIPQRSIWHQRAELDPGQWAAYRFDEKGIA
jgi:hypothetical protein